ncbi:SMC-Scp complex subunit ScpB [Candidatus Woesearchaeota archaeon]|nr:SMC-Scp complex subunit ScpB [Candidatus Woesearchaeota archaeon]
MTLKNKVEAVLFAVGKKIEADEIAKLCNAPVEPIKEALKQLQEDYNQRDCALMITGSDNVWKFDIREKYLDLVKNLVVETDLSRQALETLAIIAYSQPNCMQSDVIKKRTTNAYEHIKELSDMGFITKERLGRTRRLRLTQKFFEYFDIKKQEIKEMFEQFQKDEQEVINGEKELEKLEAEREQEREALKKYQENRDKVQKELNTKMDDMEKEVEGIAQASEVDLEGSEEPLPEWVEEEKRLQAIEEEKKRKKEEIEQRKKEMEKLKKQREKERLKREKEREEKRLEKEKLKQEKEKLKQQKEQG